jgi:hypothetical protein
MEFEIRISSTSRIDKIFVSLGPKGPAGPNITATIMDPNVIKALRRI